MRATRPRKSSGVGELVPAPEMSTDAWTGCYATGWPKELLVPDAYSHPAKFAYLLIERIYDHARAEGWMPPGSRVLDPFAGVALGALHALRLGCSWHGVELESKFFDIGRANIAKWMHDYRHLPGWGPWAMVVNGDSRRLLEHVPMQAGCVVSSPPYSELNAGKARTPHEKIAIQPPRPGDVRQYARKILSADYGTSPGQLGAMPVGDLAVSSPPYAATPIAHAEGNISGGPGGRKASAATNVNGNIKQVGYGDTPGQMASMAVASPPYATGDSAGPESLQRRTDKSARSMLKAQGWHAGGQVSPGNLANLAISSPPYADGCRQIGPDTHPERMHGPRTGYLQRDHAGYGTSEGQLGRSEANTFWEASQLILAQTFQLLRPGGHAIFVTKRYVRAGKIVAFTHDWIRCAESVGFRLLHHHKAMLVEHHGTQTTLFGEGDHVHETRRESFFRRLARMKGSPAIEWEDVTCFIKPEVPHHDL